MTCPSHTTARDLAEPAGLLALSSSGHYNQSPTLPLPASAYPGTRYHRHARVGKNSSEPTTTKVLLSARPSHPPGHSEIPGQGTAEQPRVVPKLGGSHQWGRRRPVGGLSAGGGTKLRPTSGRLSRVNTSLPVFQGYPCLSQGPSATPFSSTMNHYPKRMRPTQMHCPPPTRPPLRPELAALTHPRAAGPGQG